MDIRKEEVKVTKNLIELSDEEMELLSALADFPDWYSQADRVKDFCEELHTKLGLQGFQSYAYKVFKDVTSLS